MKTRKRIAAIWLIIAVMLSVLCLGTPATVSAAAGPKIETTLKNDMLQRGSKKTFDVVARNSAGKKIKATVTFNGKKLSPTWDDSQKTSYTLVFENEEKNTVIVSASSDGGKKRTLSYNINYKKAKNGEKIGTAVWSIELFTIGCGYLTEPCEMPIYEGETAADELLRLLKDSGYLCYYGGTTKESFYLAYIANGNITAENYNGYKKSASPKSAKSLFINAKIPKVLVPHLKTTMTFYDENDYKNNGKGYLGEFLFTNGSGWMYCVNNVFPNVGFADTYLSDGDVVRVQFTLGYGADIGGAVAVGSSGGTQLPQGYYSVANKDELTKEICAARQNRFFESDSALISAYKNALDTADKLNADSKEVLSASAELKTAVKNAVGTTIGSSLQNGSKAQSGLGTKSAHSSSEYTKGAVADKSAIGGNTQSVGKNGSGFSNETSSALNSGAVVNSKNSTVSKVGKTSEATSAEASSSNITKDESTNENNSSFALGAIDGEKEKNGNKALLIITILAFILLGGAVTAVLLTVKKGGLKKKK